MSILIKKVVKRADPILSRTVHLDHNILKNIKLAQNCSNTPGLNSSKQASVLPNRLLHLASLKDLALPF